MHKADEVSEVRLVEIEDELDEKSEVDYDKACEVGELISDYELDEDCEV